MTSGKYLKTEEHRRKHECAKCRSIRIIGNKNKYKCKRCGYIYIK